MTEVTGAATVAVAILTDIRGCVTLRNYARTVVGAGCAYESFALATGLVPTLSKLCGYSKEFEVMFFLTLATHFHLERKMIEQFEKVAKKG